MKASFLRQLLASYQRTFEVGRLLAEGGQLTVAGPQGSQLLVVGLLEETVVHV